MTGPEIGGADLDDAVIAVFSALLWHTQALREELDKNQEGVNIRIFLCTHFPKIFNT